MKVYGKIYYTIDKNNPYFEGSTDKVYNYEDIYNCEDVESYFGNEEEFINYIKRDLFSVANADCEGWEGIHDVSFVIYEV